MLFVHNANLFNPRLTNSLRNLVVVVASKNGNKDSYGNKEFILLFWQYQLFHFQDEEKCFYIS